MQVISHWSTPAPELKLLPAKLIPTIEKLCETAVLTPEDQCAIITHSVCLSKLIQHGQSSSACLGGVKLSPQLTSLLRVVVQKAKAGLSGKSKVSTQPWKSTQQPFEEMVCTGTYGPSHPVFRQMPFFRYDYLNKQQVARYARNKDKELQQLKDELKDQAQRMGSTCKKYKTRQTVLTSGIFTILCNRCGIIEYFELMCKSESPATPARALFHRAWRSADVQARDAWLQSGETSWVDPVN